MGHGAGRWLSLAIFAHGAATPAVAMPQDAPARAPEVTGAADWHTRHPDDALPDLLFELDRPGGRLARYQKVAALGARAHPALIGLLRRPFAAVPPDLIDAFGTVDGRLAWAVPALREAAANAATRPIAEELLRRIAAAGEPGAGASAPPAEGMPDAGAPAPAELARILRDGPAELRWPALQAILASGDREAALLALRALLLLQLDPACSDRADRLLHVLHCTARGRIAYAPLPAADPSPAAVAALVLDAALLRLPGREVPVLDTARRLDDADVRRALALFCACSRPRDGATDPWWEMLRSDPRVRAAAGELQSLFVPRRSAAERERIVESLRRHLRDGAPLPDAIATGPELDVVPADLLPLLVEWLGNPRRSTFASRSLLADAGSHLPALLALAETARGPARDRLLEVLGQLRPTPPELVRWACDRAFAASVQHGPEALVLHRGDPAVVEDELLRRLDAPAPRVALILFCLQSKAPRLVSRRSETELAFLRADPVEHDASGRMNLWFRLAKLGDPGLARMLECLDHEDRAIRLDALQAFGNRYWSRREQVDALLARCTDEDREIAAMAIRGLANAEHRQSEVHAALRARWDGSDAELRRDLLYAFAGLGPHARDALPLAEAALAADDADDRLAAAWAALRIAPGHEGGAAVIRALLGEQGPACARTVQRLCFDVAVLQTFAANLLPLVRSEDLDVLLAVLRALRQLPPEHARAVADDLRRLRISPEGRLQLWADLVLREKVDAK